MILVTCPTSTKKLPDLKSRDGRGLIVTRELVALHYQAARRARGAKMSCGFSRIIWTEVEADRRAASVGFGRDSAMTSNWLTLVFAGRNVRRRVNDRLKQLLSICAVEIFD